MANTTEVTIDVIIHATEDEKKFYNSFEKLFGLVKDQCSIENLVGHFENPIKILKVKLTKREAQGFIEKLVSKIPKDQINDLIDTIEDRIDNSLHLRFDKQEFVKGKLSIQENNAIKVKIYTPIYNKKDTVKTYQKLLSSSN